MKFLSIAPFAAVAAAFVVPQQEVFGELAIESNGRQVQVSDDYTLSKSSILDSVKETAEHAQDAFDHVLAESQRLGSNLAAGVFDAKSWLESNVEGLYDEVEMTKERPHNPDHDHSDRPHRPHHPGHGQKPNHTVYQLIAESNYTTRLAALINEYPDLVEALNSTKANFTVFAPIDKAFEKIPDHAPKPSKEQLKKILSYHVSQDFYPARRVLATHTIPTLYVKDDLSDKPEPQRLSLNVGVRGLTVNFYSRIIAINVFGTNGVIHGVDSVLVPPPNAVDIVDLLPGEFSTLELGLGKTGLLGKLNNTENPHPGGTLFAPNNFAFQKLGPKINAFLFSPAGVKYLQALLEYHVVPGVTLYSDALYKTDSSSVHRTDSDVPQGYSHFDLPTLLKDRSISADISRYGGFISIKLNAFSRVIVQDGIAEDGVIHVVSNVLIPPRNQEARSFSFREKVANWRTSWRTSWRANNDDMSVDEFKQRLEPYMAQPCH